MIKRAYLFILLCAALSGCKKENTDIPDISTFYGRFNGFAASISTQLPPEKGGGVTTYIANNVPDVNNFSKGNYTSALTSKNFTVYITKATLIFGGQGAPSPGELQGFFAAGSYLYLGGMVSDGIAVGFTDKNGNEYNSILGDQTNSFFKIVKSQPSGNNVKIQAEFNCKLYDVSGNIVTLSGGLFTGVFKGQ